MSPAALLLAWLGFALFCLAMPRHCMDILPGRKLTAWQQRLLTLAGAVLLLFSARTAIATSGIALGLTSWAGLLTLTLILQSLLLTYLPRLLPGSCVVMLLVAVF